MVEKTEKVTEVLGIRIEPDEKKRFEDFVKEESKNNKTFLTNLLDLYELNKGKIKNINLIGDIEELEKYTNKIQQSFVGVINKLESQKDGIREDLNKDLQIYKDKVNNLEYANEHFKLDITAVNEKINTVNNENIILIKQLEQLQKNFNDQKNQSQEQTQDKLTIIEEYKGKNDTLTGLLKQYEKYPGQLETTKDLLSAAQANILEFESKLRENGSAIIRLTNDMESLNENHKSEINNVIERHAEELERIKEKAEFDKEKSLLAKDREYQELINKLNQYNNEKVKELLNENQQYYNKNFSKLVNDNVESLKEKNKPKKNTNPI
jgi:chromosome segregation ATPase